jgi:hypothetical protein
MRAHRFSDDADLRLCSPLHLVAFVCVRVCAAACSVTVEHSCPLHSPSAATNFVPEGKRDAGKGHILLIATKLVVGRVRLGGGGGKRIQPGWGLGRNIPHSRV